MPRLNKPIDKEEFWKERIDLAKKQGYLHYSVYLASLPLWKKIEEAHLEVIRKLIKKDERVLDAGCGFARISEWFSKDKYVGVDFSPDFVNEAKRLYPDNDIVVGDLRNLPFPDKSFDWAIAISIKNMVVDNMGEDSWKAMQKELQRVCKKLLLLEYGEMEDYTDTKESFSRYEIL